MSETPERFRIQIDVPEDLYTRTKNNFPWGIRNSVLVKILEELNYNVEKHGIIVAYAINADKLSLFGGLRDESIGISKA